MSIHPNNPSENSTNCLTVKMQKQIKNIWTGEAGLAVTYWGYGAVGGALFGIPLALVSPGSTPAIIAVLSFTVYCVLVNVGIWRAAGKYQGPKIWAFLPKAGIVLLPITAVIGIAAAILIPSISNGDHAQDETPAVTQIVGECKRGMDNIREIRAKRPEWANVPDDIVVDVIRQSYYPEMSREQLAWEICVTLTPPKQLAKLNRIESWYYESCQKEAAQAPTPQGVSVGLRLCREKFGQ
jgi:hypothetical protein